MSFSQHRKLQYQNKSEGAGRGFSTCTEKTGKDTIRRYLCRSPISETACRKNLVANRPAHTSTEWWYDRPRAFTNCKYLFSRTVLCIQAQEIRRHHGFLPKTQKSQNRLRRTLNTQMPQIRSHSVNSVSLYSVCSGIL